MRLRDGTKPSDGVQRTPPPECGQSALHAALDASEFGPRSSGEPTIEDAPSCAYMGAWRGRCTMETSTAKVVKQLRADGWTLLRHCANHDVYCHS
ncbi:MAG TPA: hypothetical protein VKO16_00890, partial [Polyangia bacterium]|nr:hypothetical protein [Polyangia bacterium]